MASVSLKLAILKSFGSTYYVQALRIEELLLLPGKTHFLWKNEPVSPAPQQMRVLSLEVGCLPSAASQQEEEDGAGSADLSAAAPFTGICMRLMLSITPPASDCTVFQQPCPCVQGIEDPHWREEAQLLAVAY